MKVLPVNNYYAYQNRSTNKNHTSVAAQQINFTSLWNSSKELTLQEKFEYGLEALGDEKSVLFVTNYRESAEYILKTEGKDLIDIPVENLYTMEFPEKDGDSYTSFVIFKKNNQYHFLNLNNVFPIKVFNPKKGASADVSDYVKRNTVRILKDGDAILKKDSLMGMEKKEDFFAFKTPKSTSNANAKKCLEYRTIYENDEKIKKHNSVIFSKFLSPVKKTNSTQKDFTFADVGGLDNIIDDLRKFVLRPLKYPQVYENVRLNKGILLSGPPRCGKTLLGKALANEAGVKYRYMNANEFTMSMHGASEQKARNVFEEIMKEPTVLFIDEIDAIGKARGLGGGNAHYDDKFLTQLLGSMSDLEKSDTMSFVIAATNRKDLLDDALIQTGRFGLHLDVPIPDEKALEAIWNVHAKKQPFDDDVDVKDYIPFMFKNKFNGSDVAETITNAYFNALERLGMNLKMDKGILGFNDLKSIKIAKEDILKSMNKLAIQKARI